MIAKRIERFGEAHVGENATLRQTWSAGDDSMNEKFRASLRVNGSSFLRIKPILR